VNGSAGSRLQSWLLFVGMVAFIASTLALAFDVSSFLRARGYLWTTVQSLFAAFALAFGYALAFGAGLRSPLPYLRAFPFIAIYIYATIEMRKSPAERFHFLEYGILYYLALRALVLDVRHPVVFALAIIPTALAGYLDEVLQGKTSSRYFDWGDVEMNAVAAVLAATVLASLFGKRPELARLPYLPRPRE
jgi:hypothetical protein